jgi:hypothetical protein
MFTRHRLPMRISSKIGFPAVYRRFSTVFPAVANRIRLKNRGRDGFRRRAPG